MIIELLKGLGAVCTFFGSSKIVTSLIAPAASASGKLGKIAVAVTGIAASELLYNATHKELSRMIDETSDAIKLLEAKAEEKDKKRKGAVNNA